MPEQNNDSSRINIFSDEFISLIGEDLANQIIDTICQGLTGGVIPEKTTTLCLEILLFGIDEKVLKTLVECVFTQLNPIIIAQQIFFLLELQKDPEKVLQICKFNLIKDITKKIKCLELSILQSCDLKDQLIKEILLQPTELPIKKLSDLDYVIKHVIVVQFRGFLSQQYDKFALKLCNKVSCIYSDIEFLSLQIKQVTINFPAGELGIIEIADAAASVARVFYGEGREFQQIFDAVAEVAQLIEDLDKIYKKKIIQLEKLLSLSDTGCPTPIEAKQFLPTIPKVIPATPSTIVPVAGPSGVVFPTISP